MPFNVCSEKNILSSALMQSFSIPNILKLHFNSFLDKIVHLLFLRSYLLSSFIVISDAFIGVLKNTVSLQCKHSETVMVIYKIYNDKVRSDLISLIRRWKNSIKIGYYRMISFLFPIADILYYFNLAYFLLTAFLFTIVTYFKL